MMNMFGPSVRQRWPPMTHLCDGAIARVVPKRACSAPNRVHPLNMSRRLVYSATGKLQKEQARHPQKQFKSIADLPLPVNKWTFISSFLFPKADRAHLNLQETFRQTGRVFRIPLPFLPAPIVMTCDPDYVEAMYRYEGDLPIRPGTEPLASLTEGNGFGNGLIIANWEEWRGLRSKANKQIVPRKILEFIPQIVDVSGDLMDCFRANRGLDNTVNDVLTPLMDWSFECMGIFILGERLNLFSAPEPKMKLFQQAGINFLDSLGPLVTLIPLYMYFPTPASAGFVNAVREIEAISAELVDDRMARLKALTMDGVQFDATCFLDQWLLDETMTRTDMFTLVRDFLAAGIDTTSVTATWMLHELARRPEVQQKLREEVLSVLGPTAVPTSKQLQELRYAKNIITETLRLHPVIGTNRRTLDRDVLVGDYLLPKGTWIICDCYTMARDEASYEDSLRFDPDRWAKEGKSFASLPFGFGPRSCYGRRLAEMELLLFLVKIACEFELRTDQMELGSEGLTVMKPCEPVRVQFIDRTH